MEKNFILDSQTLLEAILKSTEELVIFVDKDGYINRISDSYAEFLGTKVDYAVGKHVRDIIENTRLPEVIKTGKEELNQVQNINGRSMIASRIPIFKEGVIVGCFGRVIFRNFDDLNKLYSRINKVENELVQYKQRLKRVNYAKYHIEDIIGESKQISNLKKDIQKISKSSSNILISGESGTGKEVFANAIHNYSRRSNQSFLCVNCATIPKELMESELFGYEEGAFTGAKKGGKIGVFQAADGGTIFLDEVGELSLNMQSKLLRVIQEREVQKIGSNSNIPIDVRIIAATNRNLFEMVDEKTFREDLYYRLNVVNITIPPLRERKEDIPLIADNFLHKYASNEKMDRKKLLKETLKYMDLYPWPGNVRELENVLERAINLMDDEVYIKPEHLPQKITGIEKDGKIESLKVTLEKAEKEAILQALICSKGRKTKAAQYLGISRTNLYEKLEKYK